MLEYPIYYKDSITGKAQMIRQGMFYMLHCRCDLPADQTYTLQILTPKKTLDLGICFQTEKGIGLSVRLPAKELEQQNLQFIAVDPSENNRKLLEINPDIPVESLEEMLTGRFIRKGEKAFIEIS